MANQGGVPLDINTLLLLRGDSTTDVSMYNCSISVDGTAAIDNNGKFDKALYWNSSATFHLDVTLPKTLSGEFTVEMWVLQETTPGSKYFISICDFCNHLTLYWEMWDGYSRLESYFIGNGSSWIDINLRWVNTLANNQWYHIALVGDGTYVHSYVNGVKTTTSTAYPTFSNELLRIGNIGLSMSRYMRGYISEFRISDIARYSGNSFTPPTEPFII